MLLSVIIPYVNEYPNIAFTVQNLIEELKGIDVEIVTVANCCNQINPKRPEVGDWGFYKLSQSPYNRTGVLKCLKYDEKLGHWNAKNWGIKNSAGERLLFLDAHTIIEQGSIRSMLESFCPGTLHMQICYMLDSRKLGYKLRPGDMGYSFTVLSTNKTEPYEVPVMSTCGMMVERKTLENVTLNMDKVWHPELGIYGGGENYMMYKLATCGYPIMIHPKATVYHYSGDLGRGYSWNYTDHMRNQFIAAYCNGDDEWLRKLVEERSSRPHAHRQRIEEIAEDVRQKCKEDREFIKTKQKCTVSEYFEKWKDWVANEKP